MKIRFIDDVRGALKLLSVQLAALWAAIVGIIAADPSLFLTAYNALPHELREFLPGWVRWLVVASAMFGTIFLARVIKQPVTKKGQINEVAKAIEQSDLEATPAEAKDTAKRIVELQEASSATICDKAPPGWVCTRPKGHSGPCAAVMKEA